VLFQDPELQSVYPTVERDVAFGLENLGVPPRLMDARVDAALHSVGIGHLRHRAVHTLSGGERQRCALAGLIAMQPRLMALDEPLSQLDAEGAALLLRTLGALRDSGVTLLLGEHRVAAAMPAADAVLHMSAGSLRDGRDVPSVAPAQPLLRQPGTHGDVAWELRSVAAGHDETAVVDGVTLSGCAGEVVALTGANGAGKTTLLRTIAGVLAPLSGSVRRGAGRVALLPQNPQALLHRPTVRAEVAWTVRREPSAAPDVDAMLAALRLQHVAARYPRDLSTGEQQRAAIAAVLVGHPAIALLDEPTRGMDAAARTALQHVILELSQRGCAVVLATHDHDLAGAVAHRVVSVANGIVRERPAPQAALA
jgi:energy-coupling factor transporter ATP-binding protein EcfA2